ncbi:MAG: hypothetical protein A2900_03845 [Candidatus Chisholmbacteria bacterium RIFCSPLOWO2_01_FULL_50_28]|uniref:Uncharacterized protein n=1 Tax=Candidatus Chisholmbacteria bacterium RIFCSPHIGHO2_01_FULL_52_32 TaxID=1797591 RepID=A0A1G1VSN9_9BACT|nr:MAG: hypothetical protein A2786_02900 [Candidatus Chisholmbacteria bacterium RIFCSPHIGHO2_01_FULL_52_32]OGY20206.1 MAG: hypothetical protein A2900_03845 [Candidatus Chisholmbacteria bacterium RIFCSPLOWO2_01_FULL_50_28]
MHQEFIPPDLVNNPERRRTASASIPRIRVRVHKPLEATMTGIVDFLTWIGTDVVAPIATALLFIGVAYFVGYKIAWSGLKRIAALADAQSVSIDTFKPALIAYAVAIVGSILVAALGAIIVLNWEDTKDFVNGIYKEAINRSSWRYGPVMPMAVFVPIYLKEASRQVRCRLRRAFRR